MREKEGSDVESERWWGQATKSTCVRVRTLASALSWEPLEGFDQRETTLRLALKEGQAGSVFKI